MSESPDVLVVDDENRLADLFATWLGPERTAITAYGGEEALEKMSSSIEVVLLDRRMPGLSGDDVLEAIRAEGYDCRIIMVTAVDPDFDIIEMRFDGYLVKPISKAELLETVDRVVARSAYEAAVRRYYALVSKKALLESEKAERELADNPEYGELCTRVEDLQSQVDERVGELSSHAEFVDAFRDLQTEN